MNLKRDQVTGALLVLVGIVVFVMTSQMRVPFSMSYPGPKALPMIAAFGFVVCGGGIFLEGMKKKEADKPFMSKEGWIRMALAMAVLAVYVFASSLIGYLFTTPFAAYALTTLFAKGSKSTLKGRIIYSVLLSVIIYVIYIYVFGLTLPSGSLF
ncbi:MAG: tripartite tricarboxylate transporter TctB family protein [Hungatella sp.]|nr:tripartite tricarboxylate transporter TctB family protein [Hungatella sp.]